MSTLQLAGVLDPKFTDFKYPFTNATITVYNADGNALGQTTLQPDVQSGGTNLDQQLTFNPPVVPDKVKSATIRWIDADSNVVTQPNITLAF